MQRTRLLHSTLLASRIHRTVPDCRVAIAAGGVADQGACIVSGRDHSKRESGEKGDATDDTENKTEDAMRSVSPSHDSPSISKQDVLPCHAIPSHPIPSLPIPRG